MRTTPTTAVFGRAEARRCGWSDAAITRAVRSGRWTVIRRGVFTTEPSTALQTAAIAAARSCRGSVISHRSALAMHGLPIVGRRPVHPEITVAPRGSGGYANVYLHRAALWSEHIVVRDGVPVLGVARTLVDVARGRPKATSVPALDAALHRNLVTVDELDEVCRRCWNWPGIGRALRAIRLADGLAESPLESISRLVMGWLRLPAPQLQRIVLDQFDQEAARLDFYWDEFGVAGEADGRVKYADEDGPRALGLEKDRQERLEDLGLVFARWCWDLPQRHPRLLAAKIEGAFRRGRAHDRAGLPRRWTIVDPPAR